MEDCKKKYLDALAKARDMMSYKEVRREDMEYLFPELAESEDEKVRKELITHCRNIRCVTEEGAERIAKWIAWLEKQGEQKPTSNTRYEVKVGGSLSVNGKPFDYEHASITQKDFAPIEPKFKNGQWIVWQDKCYNVNYNGCGYELVDQNGFSTSLEYGTIDENAHLWAIKDAKNGDVLVSRFSQPFLYNGKCNNYTVGAYCGVDSEGIGLFGGKKGTGWTVVEGVTPATKEEQDLLFQKIKEAGYEWDAKNKKLKKIHVIDDGKSEMDYCFTKMMAGEKVSPAWSEEQIKAIESLRHKWSSGDSTEAKYKVEAYDELIEMLKEE